MEDLVNKDKYRDFDFKGNLCIASWSPKELTNEIYTCNREGIQLRPSMSYEEVVQTLIRTRYSADEEFALINNFINGDNSEYNEYVSWRNKCKNVAKDYLHIERDLVAEAKENKLKELEDYDKSNAVNEFILNGNPMWIELELRKSVAHDLNVLKAKGIKNYTFWNGSTPIGLPVSAFESILNDEELYALECFNVTASHKANIEKLETIDDINAYDFTVGYPDKLTFE